MGGTSTDVCHYKGEYERAFETEVAGVRIRAPMMNIHTVAAGGGSILQFSNGRLQVSRLSSEPPGFGTTTPPPAPPVTPCTPTPSRSDRSRPVPTQDPRATGAAAPLAGAGWLCLTST